MQNKYTRTPEQEYRDSMPMCLWEDDGRDVRRFKEFVTPYFDNLFGSEEYEECAAEHYSEDPTEEELDRVHEAIDYTSHNEDCYDFRSQPKFFANLIMIHKEMGEYALDRYISDFETEISNYTNALRKYVEYLVKEGK